MPLRKILIIANPQARGGNPDQIRALAAALEARVPTSIAWTQAPGHASELAHEAGADPDTLVAACGGDGSLFEALNGLPAQGVLGLLPNGTANVVARELGVPLQLSEAAKLLLSGTLRRLDVGLVGSRKFLMVAGFGFDAEVAGSIHPTCKRLLGQYAYHLEVVRRYLGYRPPTLRVSVDGAEPVTGCFALFANMRRYGGGLFFAPGARLLSARPVRHELDGEVLEAVRDVEISVIPQGVTMVAP